ncbi:MAG: hypothetical protein FJ303_17005 [Planctomycetes bacterium]|nr:hypothetical protein [Planctomycetota bacterium]
MLQASTRLDDFEIIRLLGRGGMGEVYEARQFHPDRKVAIKVLAPWLAEDDDALQRFWREAEVPANLDHPGIVRIISTGTAAGNDLCRFGRHLFKGPKREPGDLQNRKAVEEGKQFFGGVGIESARWIRELHGSMASPIYTGSRFLLPLIPPLFSAIRRITQPVRRGATMPPSSASCEGVASPATTSVNPSRKQIAATKQRKASAPSGSSRFAPVRYVSQKFLTSAAKSSVIP